MTKEKMTKNNNLLGVAYNVFDGEELLIYSIKQIRPHVDYIVVVAQEVSNFNFLNLNLRQKLTELESLGLIDYIQWYEPIIEFDDNNEIIYNNGFINEQKKRQIGLDICQNYGCTIFSSIDCDEIYDPSEYLIAKNEFIFGNYDSSFCQMKTFYKKPTFQLSPYETYYVPLFYRINKNTIFKFDFDNQYPVIIDATRKIKAGYCRIFTRKEIQMYHYSYLRLDLLSKIKNSSAQTNIFEQNNVLAHYENCNKITDGALLLNNQKFDLIEVENKFNIQL